MANDMRILGQAIVKFLNELEEHRNEAHKLVKAGLLVDENTADYHLGRAHAYGHISSALQAIMVDGHDGSDYGIYLAEADDEGDPTICTDPNHACECRDPNPYTATSLTKSCTCELAALLRFGCKCGGS